MSIASAKSQVSGVAGAIKGNSSAMTTLGNIGSDPHPEKMLAVGLAHAGNAIEELIKVVEKLEREVAELRTRVR
ncbi:hypothetical protein [Microbacterium sp. LWH13-1.2]|uniref:hypothetical protein n=1 Tax=Microbacterium sp. LWH13-1.2 TaxID=3135260 RepID=UPI00313A2459